MGGSELCEMTELPKDSCDHCRHGDAQIVDRDGLRAKLPEAIGDFVVAEYTGICVVCREDILVGDHIAVVEEVKDQGGKVVRKFWGHYGCTK